MAEITVAAERLVAVPASRVFEVLADYTRHHPSILPPAFSDLAVERGGVGDGTVVTFRLALAGERRSLRAVVSVPAPGRVLIEDYEGSDTVTTFEVDPDGQDGSRVRITTRWTPARGPRGLVERLLAPPLMRRLYADELRRLESYAGTLAG
jgi:hypothetical protein